MSQPGGNAPIEPKVKWQAAVTYLVGALGLGFFNIVTNGSFLTDILPDPVEIFVVPLVPVLGGLIAGYAAKHQWRSGEGR
jgi:hypothetical protein